MKLAIISVILSLCSLGWAQSTSSNGTIIYGVSQDTYNELSSMAQIAMSTYADDLCASPGGYDKVYTFNNSTTDTYGWILRDDADQKLLLVFRGSETVEDFVEDSNYNQSAFQGDGINNCTGCMVHAGYWQCWTSVRDEVIAQMQTQSDANPGYGWIIIGHSLGGGVGSLAAAQTYDMFPDSNMTVYTQGQPRTGNPAYKTYVEERFGTGPTGRFFRSTHQDDIIPHLPPMSDGYVHHATEYWNRDPSGANNTWICMGADETECNEVQPESIPDHLTYYGHAVVIGGDCS